jgi:hypothetical protein
MRFSRDVARDYEMGVSEQLVCAQRDVDLFSAWLAAFNMVAIHEDALLRLCLGTNLLCATWFATLRSPNPM